MPSPATHPVEAGEPIDALARLLGRSRPVLVLTGAGVSTDSGIPDYRDAHGEWKRPQPIQYREFVDRPHARQRYWARSFFGWPPFARAEPGVAHRALARLEDAGLVRCVVTQNVDGLHARAGSRGVVDLHGRLDAVACIGCGERIERAAHQDRLAELNPSWGHRAAHLDRHVPPGPAGWLAPDGDADLGEAGYEDFRVPGCPRCAGVLKPTVVFFGEAVPRERVERVRTLLANAGALLCVGSSLMVFSGYRFVREARALGIPVGLVNLGRTRADEDASIKVSAPCGPALEALARRLT